MRQQLLTMLQMQDEMNSRVHPEWREQRYEWYRAIWIECGELMDHYGWKWWKKQQPDTEQVILELIDIWHFGLSLMLQEGHPAELIAKHIEDNLNIATEQADFRLDLETFTALTLTTKRFDIASFARLMAGVGLDFERLYRSYVGKNVLNFFRQDHGYQDGSYLKVWSGREDNEHLVELLESLDPQLPDYKELVYQGLAARYARA